jgi:UDP-N-acetylmuramoyl-tripeptide--D-alanyl-D-alanine ligase
MRALTLGEVAEACGGTLRHGDASQTVHSIQTDSRKIVPGELFLALKGDRFDAHQFLTPELVSKLSAAIVTQSLLPTGLPEFPMIDVPGVREAMGQLAHWYRRQFNMPVIGITGSNGKTSTKALLKGALSQELSVLSSPASFNNDIGVPLTLLDMTEQHRAAILEIGTNHPGEIAHLSEMVQPTHGIITSVGGSHIGHFGSVKAVAQEKGFLAEALPEEGVLFLDSDSPWFSQLAKRTRARLVTVGFGESADWLLSNCHITADATICQIKHSEHGVDALFQIPVAGKHQAVNAGLAFAAAFELGLSPDQVVKGLSQAEMPGMRMEILRTPVATLWNDAYNANEDSVIASMETFAGFKKQEGRTFMILGQLNELGDHATEVYQRLAKKAVDLGFDTLVGIGDGVDQWVFKAKAEGCKQCFHFVSNEQAACELQKRIEKGDQLLFKASRGAKLEQLVKQMQSSFEAMEKTPTDDVTPGAAIKPSIQPSACLAASAGGLFL